MSRRTTKQRRSARARRFDEHVLRMLIERAAAEREGRLAVPPPGTRLIHLIAVTMHDSRATLARMLERIYR